MYGEFRNFQTRFSYRALRDLPIVYGVFIPLAFFVFRCDFVRSMGCS